MIGFPKGSLQDATLNLFDKAGFNVRTSLRSYKPAVADRGRGRRCVRAPGIGRCVGHGCLDCGLTGRDWILGNDSDVVGGCDLVYSRASSVGSRWVRAGPEDSPVRKVEDLEG